MQEDSKSPVDESLVEVSGDFPDFGSRINFTGCSTQTPGCAGVKTFKNTWNQTVSYTVWFKNGSAGRSNFVLAPNQDHGIHVQSGDTFSYAWGSAPVGEYVARYWITLP